jgi:hypothetical protein
MYQMMKTLLQTRFSGAVETIFVMVLGDDTAGAFEVAEEITPPQSGPPLHPHRRRGRGTV